MGFFRRLFGGGLEVPPDLREPHPEPPLPEPKLEPTKPEPSEPSTLPPSFDEELESLGFSMDKTSYYGIAATRHEGGDGNFAASWASKFKTALGSDFVGGLGPVPGRWVLSIRGGVALVDSPLKCPALYAALWPNGSILCPQAPTAADAAVPGVSHAFDVSPGIVAVGHLVRGQAPLDAPTATLVRELLVPHIAELAEPDSAVFMAVEPDNECLLFNLCVYWAWVPPTAATVPRRSIEGVVRLLDRWSDDVRSRGG